MELGGSHTLWHKQIIYLSLIIYCVRRCFVILFSSTDFLFHLNQRFCNCMRLRAGHLCLDRGTKHGSRHYHWSSAAGPNEKHRGPRWGTGLTSNGRLSSRVWSLFPDAIKKNSLFIGFEQSWSFIAS